MRIKRSRYSIIKISILRQNGGYEMDNNYDEVEYQVDNQEVEKPKVSNSRAYVIMALKLVMWPVLFYLVVQTINGLNSMDMASLMTSTTPTMPSYGVLFNILTGITYLVSLTCLVLFIIDTVKISQSGRKILGVILFYIFLNPVYFIWRDYILENKKALSIIYAIITGILMVVYYSYYISNYITWYMNMMSSFR